jgi:uncharacterized protein involved in copper resistance
VADEALVLVEAVLFAVEPALVTQLRVAIEAAVLVACVLSAPQTIRVTQRSVADEALAGVGAVSRTQLALRLSCRGVRAGCPGIGVQKYRSFGFSAASCEQQPQAEEHNSCDTVPGHHCSFV